jgi:hypothetical protein
LHGRESFPDHDETHFALGAGVADTAADPNGLADVLVSDVLDSHVDLGETVFGVAGRGDHAHVSELVCTRVVWILHEVALFGSLGGLSGSETLIFLGVAGGLFVLAGLSLGLLFCLLVLFFNSELFRCLGDGFSHG